MFTFLRNALVGIICAAGLVVVLVALFLVTTPRPNDIRSCITAKMYQVHLCPRDASYAPIQQISTNLRAAVVASEDTTFYQHAGIDWYEMRQSFEKNWRTGHFARGGSTLTQQLAKNVYLSSDKSLLRKAREILIAIQIEKILSKDEILEKYLNVVEFGKDMYGVTAAAKFYFNKTPAQLSAVDGAFLAFLLPNPKKYSASFRSRKLTPFARRGIRNILFRMTSFKKLSDDDYHVALNELENMWGSAPSFKGEGEGDVEDEGTDDMPAFMEEARDILVEPTRNAAPEPDEAVPPMPTDEYPSSDQNELQQQRPSTDSQ